MNLKQTLHSFEERLMTNAVRKDAQQVSDLLHPEFREYGSSGRVYSKAEVIDQLQAETTVDLSHADFEVQPICTDAVLVTYRAVKQTPGSVPIQSLRSSIWVYRDDRWQMLFHQGTKMPQTTP